MEYEALPASVEQDDILLLDDGKLRLRVDDVSETTVDCTVLIGGKLSSRKGVNKLGGGLAAPALTEKDLDDIRAMPTSSPTLSRSHSSPAPKTSFMRAHCWQIKACALPSSRKSSVPKWSPIPPAEQHH